MNLTHFFKQNSSFQFLLNLVDSFEAKFNNTTIQGIIKEKQEAKQQYQEEFKKGSTIAYSEINNETGDVMKIMISNIPPKSTISITYSYIEKLEINLHKFWLFRLFSSLTPAYTDINDCLRRDISILANYSTLSEDNAFPWNVKIEIQSPTPITSIRSPLHKIIMTYGNKNHTRNICFETYYPNKDFVLLFKMEMKII